MNGFYLMLFSCICLMFFCFYMLSTPSLGSLGVCLMKYSSVVQRYGTVLSSLDFNYELSCWQTNASGVHCAFLPPTINISVLFYMLIVSFMGLIKEGDPFLRSLFSVNPMHCGELYQLILQEVPENSGSISLCAILAFNLKDVKKYWGGKLLFCRILQTALLFPKS